MKRVNMNKRFSMRREFDITCTCAIYGKVGHTFEECEGLQDSFPIQKFYIQLRVTLQTIKGMGSNQSQDINSLRFSKLSYVNFVNLLPPQPHQDTASVNCLGNLEQTLMKFMSTTC